jgi:anti-anti-sigma factor
VTIRSEETARGIWVISANGRLDQSLTPQLEKTLNQLLDSDPQGIIVDLGQATYINSGGLRCLVSAWRRAKRQANGLVLCGLSPRLTEIFMMVGFDQVFEIYDTCAQAREHPFT